MLASLDGYCSIVVFDPDELGTPYKEQQHQLQMSAIAEGVQSHGHVQPQPQTQQHEPQQPQQPEAVNQLPVKKKRRVELTKVE